MTAYIPVALQREVRRQFRDCCAYCRTAERLTSTTFEYEHIQPISAGGQTLIENLCLSCPTCNRHKSSRQLGIDPESNNEVPLFHPQAQIWVENFQWNSDDALLVGLTDVGRATIATLRINRPAAVRVRRLWVAMGEHPPQF